MTEETLDINVKVPKKYAKKKYLKAIGLGLYMLAFGEKPESEETEPCQLISVRFSLSPKAAEYWEVLLPAYENNKRMLAREALHSVSLEPEHCLQCRI